MEGRQEVLDSFILGPEIPVQGLHIGNGTLALLGD